MEPRSYYDTDQYFDEKTFACESAGLIWEKFVQFDWCSFWGSIQNLMYIYVFAFAQKKYSLQQSLWLLRNKKTFETQLGCSQLVLLVNEGKKRILLETPVLYRTRAFKPLLVSLTLSLSSFIKGYWMYLFAKGVVDLSTRPSEILHSWKHIWDYSLLAVFGCRGNKE